MHVQSNLKHRKQGWVNRSGPTTDPQPESVEQETRHADISTAESVRPEAVQTVTRPTESTPDPFSFPTPDPFSFLSFPVAGAEAVATVGHRQNLDRIALLKHATTLLK